MSDLFECVMGYTLVCLGVAVVGSLLLALMLVLSK